MSKRILVVSHGHPDFSLGGGEVAACNLFRAYRADPRVEAAWLLARVDRKAWPTGDIRLRREDEYLWDQAMHDWHYHRAAHPDSLRQGFAELLHSLKPSVVHAHHYAHLGIEYLQLIKRHLPGTQVFLTLHEFMAICKHNGQMVKTGSLSLCDRSTPEDCQRCFPDRSVEDFWLRREYLMDRLKVVDGFFAPSEFLRQRYIEWGLAPEKIVTLENGQPDGLAPLPPRPLAEGETRNRFAFFGQINPYKGLDVLLRALTLLSKSEQKRLVLEVHGAHFEAQPLELRERIAGFLEPLQARGVVQWVGPYRPGEQRQRMADVDWVVIPSIWWENSPMVIQEAFAAGRPLVCSDIGGMAEKVRHDVDGVHVPVGNAHAWARTLLSLSADPARWDRLRAGIRPVLDLRTSVDQHLAAIDAWPSAVSA